jgi:pimeloyl-ACP methyl ester carboxylesterase
MSIAHPGQFTNPPAIEMRVQERPLQLGPDHELIGVLTTPVAAGGAATHTPVIFLNAGVIHRVGPHRLHVNLARRLAAQGVTSVRLDLSGIGDSRSVPGTLTFRQSAVADTRTTLDWLGAELGAKQFVLFGLCSGADNALATAAADERVTGLILIDPPAYVTRQAQLRKTMTKLRQNASPLPAAAWGLRAIRRLGSRVGAGRDSSDGPQLVGGREVPPPAEYRAQLDALVSRGVAILAVFTGALQERYNHPDQLFELFPELRGKVDRAYFPAANHTFTELAAQADLMSTVCAWIERRR